MEPSGSLHGSARTTGSGISAAAWLPSLLNQTGFQQNAQQAACYKITKPGYSISWSLNTIKEKIMRGPCLQVFMNEIMYISQALYQTQQVLTMFLFALDRFRRQEQPRCLGVLRKRKNRSHTFHSSVLLW